VLSTTPDTVNREVSQEEAAAMHAKYVAPYMPDLSSRCIKAVSCLYTATPDAEFVIDCLPARAEKGLEAAGPAIEVRGLEVKLAGAEQGRSQRFVVTVKSSEITVKLGGKETQRLTFPTDAPSRGAFGLRAVSRRLTNDVPPAFFRKRNRHGYTSI